MTAIKKIEKVVSKIAEFASYVSFIGIVVMMLFIAVDVFMRKVFSKGILGSYEIVQYMLMIAVFASFGFTQVKKMHVRVTLFTGKLPWRARTFINGLWELICAVMATIVGYAALIHGNYLLHKGMTSDVLRFPLYPFHYIEALMMFIFALTILCDALRYFFAISDKEYALETFKEYS